MKLKDRRPSLTVMQPVDLEASALRDPTTGAPTPQPLRQYVKNPCPCSAFPVVLHAKTHDEL